MPEICSAANNEDFLRDSDSESFQEAPILQISSSIDDAELEVVTCNQLPLFNWKRDGRK